MTRAYERLEGLSVMGPASLEGLDLSVPALLWSSPDGTRRLDALGREVPTLSDRHEATPGHRSLEIALSGSRSRLDFPVGTPEVSGTAGGLVMAAPTTWVIHWPIEGAEWSRLAGAHPELVVLSNGRALLSEGRPFVRALGEVRQRLGAEPLLWVPRVALPHRVAELVYFGIDLVDTTEALLRSSAGEFLTAELGPLDGPSSGAEVSCRCESCASGTPIEDGGHAELEMAREMRLVRASIRAGRLRELVEARLTAEPLLSELLRYADRDLAGPLEERSPVTGTPMRAYVLKEAQRRPEAVRYRARFLERYRPPRSKEVLLVVPCSRTKPYRNSPTHRRILGALEGLPNRSRIHIVSVTSPLGIVPRELEDVLPARHYDIPVTHEWDEEERSYVSAALGHLLGTGSYRSVLLHLDPDEYGFLKEAIGGSISSKWTVTDGRTTSAPSLKSLEEAARLAPTPLDSLSAGPLSVVKEELEGIAGFQFGREAARLLFAEPTRLHGRPWFQRLSDGSGTDLATLREERGLFQLTVAGARRMASARPFSVQLRPEVPLRGDLFVPGVAAADPSIRSGDAVIVERDDEVLAVGEAALPGRLMNELHRGLAVRLRHRAHRANAVTDVDRQSLDRGN